MTIDRERERPGVAMDNGRRTTEVVQTGGVNVVLCIEALLARLIGVGRRQRGPLEANLADLCTAPDVPRSWTAVRAAWRQHDLLRVANEGPLLALFGILRVEASEAPGK